MNREKNNNNRQRELENGGSKKRQPIDMLWGKPGGRGKLPQKKGAKIIINKNEKKWRRLRC